MFVPRSKEWEELFVNNNYLATIRLKGINGQLRSSRFRSVCWKVRRKYLFTACTCNKSPHYLMHLKIASVKNCSIFQEISVWYTYELLPCTRQELIWNTVAESFERWCLVRYVEWWWNICFNKILTDHKSILKWNISIKIVKYPWLLLKYLERKRKVMFVVNKNQ